MCVCVYIMYLEQNDKKNYDPFRQSEQESEQGGWKVKGEEKKENEFPITQVMYGNFSISMASLKAGRVALMECGISGSVRRSVD